MPRLLFRCLEWPDVCAGSERGGMPELMQEREPYVAAVVASMDRYMGKYGAHVQLQGPKVAIVLVRLAQHAVRTTAEWMALERCAICGAGFCANSADTNAVSVCAPELPPDHEDM